eukprot:1149403-Pelagomonas_calceolata.AAC.2
MSGIGNECRFLRQGSMEKATPLCLLACAWLNWSFSWHPVPLAAPYLSCRRARNNRERMACQHFPENPSSVWVWLGDVGCPPKACQLDKTIGIIVVSVRGRPSPGPFSSAFSSRASNLCIFLHQAVFKRKRGQPSRAVMHFDKGKRKEATWRMHVGTGEGSVASYANKWEKPVFPGTEVALICSAWGNNRTSLQQTKICSCIAECAPCKLLLTCLLAPPRHSAADQIPEAPLPAHRGRGCRSPHRINTLRANSSALTSQLAVHITPLLQHD